MLPLPHDGVCTDCKLKGCSHLISRTPECLHCVFSSEKNLHVFFSKEQKRASLRPIIPFSLLAFGEFSGLQCKSSSGASSSTNLSSLADHQHGMCSGWRPRRCQCPIARVPHYTCTTVPILCGLHFGLERPSVPQCSTSKPDSGDQNPTKRQQTTGTLQN